TVTISSFSNQNSDLCGGSTNVAVNILVSPPIEPVKPVLLSLSYLVPPAVAQSELGDLNPNQISLLRSDPVLSACRAAPTSVNTAQQTITAALNHLSSYVLGAVAPSDNPAKTRIFPNPFM